MISNFIDGAAAFEKLLLDARSGNVRHAYIIEGARGVGKKTAAELFAMALHCTGESKPCGKCRACKQHEAHTHPDVYSIEPEDNGNLKIDTVRAATDEFFMRPKLSDRKILIVNGADGMNSAAQNALLKPFEEPPSYGTVILLSENMQNILPTLRSRGVKLRLEPFPAEKIKTYVEREFPALRDKSVFVSLYSGGIVGRAREICEDGEFFALRSRLFSALKGLSGGKECIFPIAEVFGYGKKTDAAHRTACFDLMLSFLGDASKIKNGHSPVNSDCAEDIRAFASRVTAASLVNAVETTAKTASELNASMKYDVWIIRMLIKCWRDLHGNSSRS